MTQANGFLDHPLSMLELRWAERPVGANQSPRRFLDFVVDGQSLFACLGEDHDYITPLLRTPTDWYEVAIQELQLLAQPELEEGRQALYVCPECSDLGCGAVSAVICQQDGRIIWKDFAYYNTFHMVGNQVSDTPLIRRDGYEHLGPFVFDAEAYGATLQGALPLLRASLLHT